MKNLFKVLGIIAMVAIIGFGFIACGDGGSVHSGPVVISGTIGGTGPSPNIIARSAYDPEANVKKFSGTVQGDNTIQGILEDGDMLFKLTGVYDPETKAFSMQAASSMMVFALTGRLTASNAIDASESAAVLHVKQGDNWETISLGSIAPSNANVSGSANQVDENITPEWARGVWFDQLTGLKITVSEKAISMSCGDFIVPFNVLDITPKSETTGQRSLEILTRAVLLDEYMETNYTSRFYVAESWDSTLSNAIGSVKLNDIFDFLGDDLGNKTLTEAQAMLGSKKMFIAPFCATAGTGVITEDMEDILFDGYSPLFTADNNGSAAAKSATALKPVPTFFMALEPTMKNYFVPAVGELTITGLSEYNGKYVTAESNSGNVRLMMSSENFGGVKVENNQVKLNVYTIVDQGNNSSAIVGYEGSGTFDLDIFVSSYANSMSEPPGDIDVGRAKNVTFTTGKATAAFVPGPRLTITGLSDFNGKYVSAFAHVDDTIINATAGRYSMNGVQVSGGQVVLKVTSGNQLYDHVQKVDSNGNPVFGSDGYPIWIEKPKDNPKFFDGNGKVKFEVTISTTKDPFESAFEKGSVTITLTDFAGTGTYAGPPSLTITGLSAHNGKYVTATANEYDSAAEKRKYYFEAFGNLATQTGGLVQGGQVKLQIRGEEDVTFTGTGDVEFSVYIHTVASDRYTSSIEGSIVTVNFTNNEPSSSSVAYIRPPQLTITGLGAYNGKYIYGLANDSPSYAYYLYATAGAIGNTNPNNYARIQNGQVTLNVYSGTGAESNFTPINGTEYTFRFSIYESNDGTVGSYSQSDDTKVIFTDGVGSAVYEKGQWSEN